MFLLHVTSLSFSFTFLFAVLTDSDSLYLNLLAFCLSTPSSLPLLKYPLSLMFCYRPSLNHPFHCLPQPETFLSLFQFPSNPLFLSTHSPSFNHVYDCHHYIPLSFSDCHPSFSFFTQCLCLDGEALRQAKRQAGLGYGL